MNHQGFGPDAARLKGRGARSNRDNRFEALRHEASDDGWPGDHEPLPPFRTHVATETARTILSYNRSPDIGFDRSVNPYRGCEHGCIYCFARPSHAFLGLSPGLDFETRLIARPNAPELLEKALSARGYQVAPIAIGTNTDPYQPIERDLGVMRACLQVLARARHPVAIVTKGALIERDIAILSAMAADGLVRVGISLTTLDAVLSRRMEPRAPAPARRLQTIQRLSDAGIPVRAMLAPVVPGLTDHEIETLLNAASAAGAVAASWIMLRLPREVSELVQEWLATHYPARAARVMTRLREMHGGMDYDSRWFHRMKGSGPHAEMIAQRFDRAARAAGLDRPLPPLRCDLFEAPLAKGAQGALF